MYLINIQIKNIGPIEKLDYKFPFFDNGNPKPAIFVGENGSGKTILVSYIVESFFQFKRQHYEDIEIEKDKLFKLQSLTYIKGNSEFGSVNLEFLHKNDALFLTELLSKIPYDQFIAKYQDAQIANFNKNDDRFKQYGLFQNYSRQIKTKTAIDDSVLLYFPDNRYELPAWLNKEALLKREFESKMKLITESRRRIIITDALKNLEGWILDVVLDTGIYNDPISNMLRGEINKIIRAILINKFPEKQGIRFGINTRKRGTRVGIYNDILAGDGKRVTTEELAPTLYHLSSGESSLLVLFGSILRDFDGVVAKSQFMLEDIEGIVAIDEIDSHLHIDLQINTLPSLIKLFPKIQFIITTHSPFFLSGMKQAYGEDLDIIDLPEGNAIEAYDFSEFIKAQEIFAEEGSKFKRELHALKAKLQEITAPLLITEGKNDWKHLKKAKEKLGIDANFCFHEYEGDMGDEELLKICKARSKLLSEKVIIFIFDRDNPKIFKEVSGKDGDFKNWGNNVFSFIIPVPNHRKDYKNISIEFYYSDDEIKTKDSNGRRLFLSCEFREKSGCHKAENYLKLANAKRLKDIIGEKEAKIIDSEVFNENDENVALSKANFAEYVLKDTPPFGNFKFDEFRKIFGVIENILGIAGAK